MYIKILLITIFMLLEIRLLIFSADLMNKPSDIAFASGVLISMFSILFTQQLVWHIYKWRKS